MRGADNNVDDSVVPGAPLGERVQQPADAGAARSVVPIDDWDCLLVAVAARLRLAVAEAPMHLHNGSGKSLQAVVLECADALGQLHAMLSKTLGDTPPAGVKSAAAADDRGAAPALP
jgi:hypothetical protein